ncbi:MAG: hypothetical protein Q9N34_10540 [Aquificota bacterium]|nr:hypothetical protein [Aquificota bacterium]
MGFLDRIVRRGGGQVAERWSFGDLVLMKGESVERDPDTKIEEYWIETLDTSDDGYWVLVGRRYGVFQLYDWKGRLYRLPARPPSQSVTDIVFEGRYLGIVAPPYLAIYYLQDPRNTSSWKTFRISQEGLRPSGGLDVKRGTLVFGVIGEKVYAVDLSGDLSQETVDFKSTFYLQGRKHRRPQGSEDTPERKDSPRGDRGYSHIQHGRKPPQTS